jgi:hypothetical protein
MNIRKVCCLSLWTLFRESSPANQKTVKGEQREMSVCEKSRRTKIHEESALEKSACVLGL